MDDEARSAEQRFAEQRKRMLKDQIEGRGLYEPRLLESLRRVPRHRFVPPEYRHMAYTDGPLPIGQGQTISQPYIVALMTSLLLLQGEENVLEVGTGSGYQAAVLAHLARSVHTIERHDDLAQRAERLLAELGLPNACVHTGDGSLGLPAYAPYQGILVTAAAPETPTPLLEQLDEGGRLVLPVGGRGWQTLERYTRRGNAYDKETLISVAFVPLRGEHGWKEDRWQAS